MKQLKVRRRIVTADQLDAAKRAWEEARVQAASEYELWGLARKSGQIFVASLIKLGYSRVNANREYRQLLEAHGDANAKAMKHFMTKAKEYEKLLRIYRRQQKAGIRV